MKYKLNKYVLGIIAFTFLMSSCDNDDVIPTLQPVNQDILTFSSEQDFQNTLQKVSAMKSEERTAWEKSKGFKSFGTICDKVYKGIDPTKFKSLQQVKDTVLALNAYLEIKQNKDGDYYVDPKDKLNPTRYLMNNDKLYIIKDSVYKQFENGILAMKISNIEKLKQIKSIDNLKTDNTVTVRNKVLRLEYNGYGDIESMEQWGIKTVNGQKYAIQVILSVTQTQVAWMSSYRNVRFSFHNYKWTAWVYWGDYLSHTNMIVSSTTSDSDYKHIGDTYNEVNDAYEVSHSYSISAPVESNDIFPCFLSYHVGASNGRGCSVSEDYSQP